MISRLVVRVLVATSLTSVAAVPLLGVRRLDAVPEDAPRPTAPFTYDAWSRLLEQVVTPAGVDYPALLRHEHELRAFVGHLAEVGPTQTPELFPTEAARLAYYVNTYNALTLLGVVAHLPVASVHQIRGLMEPTPGFGFFFGLRFRFDGARMSLYQLEHDVLRGRFADARIHAAINCASRSCPALAPRAYLPEGLETQLDEATRALCSEEAHVRVDPGRREIVLSSLFDWFREDFEVHARRLGAGAEVLDFISHYAAPPVQEALRAARAGGYAIRYLPYDWSLNQAGAPGPSAAAQP